MMAVSIPILATIGILWVVQQFNPYNDDELYLWSSPWWLNRPNRMLAAPATTAGQVICTDAFGHRCSPDRQVPLPRSCSIALWGASNMFGFRLPWEETLAAGIERLTGEQVVNFGVMGHTSSMGKNVIRMELEHGQWSGLKTAIVQYGINDVHHWVWEPDRDLESRAVFILCTIYPFRHLADRITNHRYAHTNSYLPRVSIEQFKLNLLDIDHQLRSHGIRPLYLPDPIPFHEQAVRNASEILQYFNNVPEYYTYDAYDPKRLDFLYKHAVLKGWVDFFPSMCPDTIRWLEYERAIKILFPRNTIDINAILKDMDPGDVFIKGSTHDGNQYPDFCHINEAGWQAVLTNLQNFHSAEFLLK